LSALRGKIFPVKNTGNNKVLVYSTTPFRKSQESCCTPLANFVQLGYNVNKERRKCYD